MKEHSLLSILKETFQHFFSSNTFQKGAALAYYAVFSILPIIVILTSTLGILFGKQAVSGEIYSQLKDVLGNDASLEIQNIIKNQHTKHNNILTSIIGFITLAFSASGMFSQVHNAFNHIWNIQPKPKSSILKYFTKHFASFFVLLSVFFIITVSTTLNSFLLKFDDHLNHSYKLFHIYEHITSFLVLSFCFAIMFQFLGDAKIKRKASILGGIFTSLLFIFGKVAIGIYISDSHLSSTFGSASVLAVLMLWVYYTSQILFLGASFVKMLNDKFQ